MIGLGTIESIMICVSLDKVMWILCFAMRRLAKTDKASTGWTHTRGLLSWRLARRFECNHE